MSATLLPPDIEAACNAAHEALAWANTVVSLVDDAKRWKHSHKLDGLCKEAASGLDSLLKAVQKAMDTPDSVMVELTDAYDEGAVTNGKTYTSFHKAANAVSVDVLETVWFEADYQGFGRRVLDLAKVAKAWPDLHEKFERGLRRLPEIDESLFAMLTKEAVRAARNRGKKTSPPPQKHGNGKRGRKPVVNRDEQWLAEFEQKRADGEVARQADFARLKGVSPGTVTKAFQRARAARGAKKSR